MKTRHRFWQLTMVFIMSVFAAIQAAEVGQDDILAAARKWIHDNAVFKLESPNAVPEKAIQMKDKDGNPMPLWQVDLSPNGYLVMSSDDTLPPVVTFNTKGSFELPEGHPLASMLARQGEIFQDELDKPKTRGNEFAHENQARWNALLNRTRANSVTPSEIITAPMLTTKWNQNTPYNYLSPTDGNYMTRAVTGCTCTAFAQMLKYHEWPPVGQGTASHQDIDDGFTGSFQADFSFPYEWNLMRDDHKDNWNSSYPRTIVSRTDWAVARLMMEMGVYCNANYKTSSTGATEIYFKNLAAENLKFAPTAEYGIIKSGYYGYVPQETLYARIHADMLAERPAIMTGWRYDENGEPAGGHAFIADGLATMDSLDYYHFNYGWSGSQDGWYLLTAATTYIVERATTNIQPSPVAVFRPMSLEQSSSFTLSWDFPKRLTAEAFRLTKTGGFASTVVSSSIAGTARSYSMTGQSGTATYKLEAKVNGTWQAASDGVTVTVKTNPAPMLSLMVDDELNSVAGQLFTTTVGANNTLQSLTVKCSRPDMVPDSSITVTGNGTTRTIGFTPAGGLVGNAILYLTGVDTVGNVARQTVLLRVLESALTRNTTFNNAKSRALLMGKLVLMVSGSESNGNTSFFLDTICENTGIKANLLANYELWYDSSLSGRAAYADDLGSVQPFIAVIDPADGGTRLRSHGGAMTMDEAKVFLDTILPYFSLTDTTLTAGTTQSLELSVLDPNAEIRYRLDSSTPTASGMLYSDPIQLTAATTVSARTFKYGRPISDTVTKTYTFLPQVATPVLNVGEVEFFSGSRLVTASCATAGVTLRYTTDGTVPTAGSPVCPTAGLMISEDTLLMVCAFKTSMKPSEAAISQLCSTSGFISGDGIALAGDETTWFAQTETYYSAPSAMQSRDIDNDESTTLAATVTGGGELSFYWKVSSESTYDKLTFSIDGVKQAEISGDVDWMQKTFTVSGSGEHKLVWKYTKDSSVSNGSDCGWVDDIVWIPDRIPVSIAISGPGSIATASTATYTCTATWSDGTTSTVTPTWTVSPTTYATVSTAGVVTNQNTTTTDQTATLTASYTIGGVTKTATKSVTLAKKQLTGISISGPGSIATASTATYACMATWSYGGSTAVTPTWSVSPTTYASVSTTGVVTNNNTTTTDQTVTLNASYTAGGVTKTASKSGIILAGKAPATLVSIVINGSTSIATASTATYTCTATWSDGTTSTVAPTWSLSSTSYASVSTSGVVTNQNTETTDKTVTLNASYTYGNVTKMATKTVTLAKKVLTGISISGNATIETASTASYTCKATWSYGGTTTVTLTWSLSSTDYASVNTSGIVTNNNTTTSDKTVTLNASYTVNGVTKTAAKIITLKAAGDTVATQTLALRSGWNWVSFNVLPESRKVGDVLGTAGFTVNDVIQKNGEISRFTNAGWRPGSFTVEFGKLYQIYVDKAVTVTVSGDACGTCSVPLVAGWNWIGNPTAAAVSPSQLTHSGGWTANDRIQAAGGGNVAYMNAKWVPAGFTLEPGMGCQIYTTNAGTLAFPSAGEEDDALYVVVDLSGGPDAASYPVRYSATGPNLSNDTCRTTELWLRKIPAETFIMGSPEDEVGRSTSETQHQVTLTQSYYIGVFECTQRQWELVMGSNPSYYRGDCRPVEYVSYDMIRGMGAQAGAGWPTHGHEVDASSFMGKLQAKTGLTFDLPTEAQWEYACRAGTTTALNSGKNLSSTDQDAAMAEVGRYSYNKSDGKGGYSQHTKVGSYLRNAWGLYDMHGNVWEWCLDWYNGSYGTAAVSDPVGPNTGSRRVLRGGGWGNDAKTCSSAMRGSNTTGCTGDGGTNGGGFRVLCLPPQDLYTVVDLSDGPDVASYPVRYTNEAPDLSNDTCRTTELWLRKIPAGTFIMGSPEDELGRDATRETRQHQVTLTQDYYMGVFECTQKQWELVMGSNPSSFMGDSRPVERVRYSMIRGTGAQMGAGWPAYGHAVDATSFMGKLQVKTGLTFDLPTEAQWEYACRAGTTTALNSGKNLTNTGEDAAMAEVGRYSYNQSDGKGGYSSAHTKVGSYLPNAWGLYDMHGNVWEWCLDWWTTAVSDSVGPDTGSKRVLRGGGWDLGASCCRSAYRHSYHPSDNNNYYGFRVVCLP